MSAGDLVQAVLEQRRTDPARGAKAAALMGKEARKISDDCQNIARPAKHHEGAAAGQILKAKFAIEFCAADQRPGRAADLHRLNILRPAVSQRLPDSDTKRIFINARRFTVAADT